MNPFSPGIAPLDGRSVAAKPRVIRAASRHEKGEEREDPYAQGYEDAADLTNPPDCPYTAGISAKLWRSGFNARISSLIAARLSRGGLGANISDLEQFKR